jgi:predicted SnoaL-like aldol condensation-catalyzing enzyme
MSLSHESVLRTLLAEVMNRGRLDLVDELYTPRLAPRARAWIAPFLESFSDVDMRLVDLLADGDRVAARFSCSGTHTGAWRGHAATGRRFHQVAEVYFFRFEDGRIAEAWGVEDDLTRLRQLGLLDVTAPDHERRSTENP